jgi:RNA polymerase sigma-70 factor, ECF subfamily
MPTPNHPESNAEKRSIPMVDTQSPAWLLAQAQTSIKAYILSLLSDSSDADDILQETNTYLLKNLDTFEAGTNFKAWAFRVAYFRVKSHLRDQQRRGHVELSDSLIDHISAAASDFLSTPDDRLVFLKQCIQKLGNKDRQLLVQRYVENRSLSKLAKQSDQTPNSFHKALSRIRQALRICVERHQAHESL